MRDAFIAKLSELAAENARIALITGDLGFGVLTQFADEFPNQFVNAGVAEQNMTALACGMALSGWKAYTYSIANFTTLRCLEQIRNDVCYHGADVCIVSVGAGFSYGQLGMSHFATEDLAIMRALPGIRVVTPAERWEVEDLTEQLAAEPGPAYMRIDKGTGGTSRRTGERAIIGKARRIRDGSDVSLLSVGAILRETVAAAERLADDGISAEVISFPTIKPVDVDAIIKTARKTRRIVTIEEHTILGGFGALVAETCLEATIQMKGFKRIGLQDCYPSIVGDQNFLRSQYGMDATAIYNAAQSIVDERARC
jgi:transketolase